VLAPGSQSGNFWIHPPTVLSHEHLLPYSSLLIFRSYPISYSTLHNLSNW